MQRPKIWQIVLFAVTAIAVGVSVYITLFRNAVDLPHRLVLIDVHTGDLYSLDSSGKTIPIPARSPASGEQSLYPVAKSEDGEWVVDARTLEELRALGEDAELAVDPETGRVVVETKSIKRITPRDLRRKG